MGRVPVIISDDWVEPNGPNWEGFSIRVAEREIADIPRLLEAREPDALAMGNLAREEWQRWFSDEVAFHRVVDWCLQIRDRRRLPEMIARLPLYFQLLRPFHLKWALRSLLRKQRSPSDAREPHSANTLRIVLTKVAKAFLSPFRFRGKGRILSTLCPRAGRIRIALFGYEFWCDLSENIQRNIFLFGYDHEAERFIRSKLQAGDTFLDIGANVGFYALLAASIVGEHGRVIAIEPNPKTFRRLKETIEANAITNVVALNLALGRERGRSDLFIDPQSGNDTATMVIHDGRTSVKVEVYSLDEITIAHQINRIDYLKIDVDGFEPDVFAGAKRLLSEGKIKFIQTEFCDYWLRRNSSSPEMLHQLVTSAGFTDTGGVPTFADQCIIDRSLPEHLLLNSYFLLFGCHRQRLSPPSALSITKRTPAAFLLGMQTLSLSSNGKNGQLPYSKTSMRLRAFRFLSERFAQRERPNVAAEFILFALIVVTSTWSILSLAHAMRIHP